MALNKRIGEIRESRNLLQKDVARALGLSLRSYQRYEHGERVPDANTLAALGDYFDVPVDYLLGRGLFAHEKELLAQRDALLEIMACYIKLDELGSSPEISDIFFLCMLDTLFAKIEFISPNEITVFPKFFPPNKAEDRISMAPPHP